MAGELTPSTVESQYGDIRTRDISPERITERRQTIAEAGVVQFPGLSCAVEVTDRAVAEAGTQELLTDLHNHSYLRAPFILDEHVMHSPRQLVKEAREIRLRNLERGIPIEDTLGGVALTGHDTLRGVSEAVEAGEEFGVVVTPGVEITGRPGKYGPPGRHFIVLLPTLVALELEDRDSKLPTWRGPRYIAEWTHERGGVVIAAHPKPRGDSISMSFKQLGKAMDSERRAPKSRLDGMETLQRCKLTPKFTSRLEQQAEALQLAPIGSSDAHMLKHLGVIATRVSGLPENYGSDDILEAIRDRRTEATLLAEPVGNDMTDIALLSYLHRRKQSKKLRQVPA